MNLDGTDIQQLTENETFDWTPKWSADGSQLVFVSGRDDEVPSLYAMNPDGSDQRLLVNHEEDFYPDWSPDGRSVIFFSGSREERRFELFSVNTATGRVSQLTTEGGGQAAWSPDGSRIAYASNGEIVIIEPDGSNPRVLPLGPHPRGPRRR